MARVAAALGVMLASATAFAPSSFAGSQMAVRTAAAAPAALSMVAAKDMPGVTAPLGFFDPLGFSQRSAETTARYRESELRHGRVAMLAVVGWLTTEVVHLPMYAGASMNPLEAMRSVPFWGWVQIFMFCGVIEFVQSKVRERPGYVAGDYIGSTDLADQVDDDWRSFQTKELSNGRLAMLAIMGFIAQTALTGQNIIEQSTGKAGLF